MIRHRVIRQPRVGRASHGRAVARDDGAFTERYGVFVQSGYQWGDTTSADASGLPAAPVKAVNWTGLYVGAHLGGSWSDGHWSDPFGSAPSGYGATSITGFGDQTHATGPLGGGQIGADWQMGPLVLGIEADASAADLRGDNTCSSGLGGINCEHIVSEIGTVTGRVGYAWDRSLVYAKAGGAWANTTCNLNGNTFAVTLGTGSTTEIASGWVVGAGIEYALTDHWTTSVEYDHIRLAAVSVPFPTVAVEHRKHQHRAVDRRDQAWTELQDRLERADRCEKLIPGVPFRYGVSWKEHAAVRPELARHIRKSHVQR